MVTKKRITITLDPGVIKQVRDIQTWYMLKTNKNWSFSKAVENLIEIGIVSLKTRKGQEINDKTISN